MATETVAPAVSETTQSLEFDAALIGAGESDSEPDTAAVVIEQTEPPKTSHVPEKGPEPTPVTVSPELPTNNEPAGNDDSDSDSSDDDSDIIARMAQLAGQFADDEAPEDGGGADDDNYSKRPIHSKNEAVDAEPTQVTITHLPDDVPLVILGQVSSIVDRAIMITSAPETAEQLNRENQTLNLGTPIALGDRQVIGGLDESIGSIFRPTFVVRFASTVELTEKWHIALGTTLYYSPPTASKISLYYLRSQNKGSDASNLYDEEIVGSDVDFSDDDAEMDYKAKKQKEKRAKAQARKQQVAAAAGKPTTGVASVPASSILASASTRMNPFGSHASQPQQQQYPYSHPNPHSYAPPQIQFQSQPQPQSLPQTQSSLFAPRPTIAPPSNPFSDDRPSALFPAARPDARIVNYDDMFFSDNQSPAPAYAQPQPHPHTNAHPHPQHQQQPHYQPQHHPNPHQSYQPHPHHYPQHPQAAIYGQPGFTSPPPPQPTGTQSSSYVDFLRSLSKPDEASPSSQPRQGQ
ncbi:Gar1/Naf1 RNA binding region-domain-containing protein [Dimargaris cristalligena]|uniref:Gar1/Naf1 RNA binding region-domain-containing protein n=1 Tax=Dimargaris cristalligena TaxID=215637 RepID=A0A4P9ZXA8_9FUNG|nr:Gar1/Naf1 RNA binding region-domain-containing protein [Dimargaris cristalligena]|eukprot:RKP38267.1 Gar1/Naf1 RNA binding region-domain-containing protein [Dimargaris cristalligena]